jgi:hypothetical protein
MHADLLEPWTHRALAVAVWRQLIAAVTTEPREPRLALGGPCVEVLRCGH